MGDKTGLPSYADAASASPPLSVRLSHVRRRGRVLYRSRTARLLIIACVALVTLAQWKQLWHTERRAPHLSLEKLNADFETCKKLQVKPKDPIGLGREKNSRYVDGGKPTLIKNATIWVGEPVAGTSDEDARAGRGWEWTRSDVLLERGLITQVGESLSTSRLPADTVVYDAEGRQLTSGIIDMHSHAGVMSLPFLKGYDDTNEMSDNLTPWARSKDGLFPLDPQIQVIKSGGVTTSLVLPGSGNSIGGEAYVIKHAVGKDDGRPELSFDDLLADPDHTWRYMKMACGENPKRVHGSRTTRPLTRMGESYDFRHAFEQARDVVRRQDDWCAKAEALGVESVNDYLPQEIAWESLAAAMRGQVHINTHCYTIPDLEAMVDHTNEFSFPIRAFHHAHQTYLVPEILKRTWGGRPPSSALFADNMYYKTESYVGSPAAGKYLYDAGLTPVYVSDNPVLNAQHVVFEAAKAYHYGLPYHAALSGVTSAPADELGLGNRLGKIKPGFDADIVVWDSDPLSVGAAPVQVWIDGIAQYEDPVVLSKPLSKPVVPDTSLEPLDEEPAEVADAVFTGVTKVLLEGYEEAASETGEPFNVAISGGRIACVGTCRAEIEAATSAGTRAVDLKNGYLHRAYVGVGGTLGLNEIDAESDTDNGGNPTTFSRAVDGLLLGSKKLTVAFQAGVTRAISAPKFSGQATYHGTSVGFVTKAKNGLQAGAIFAEDVAVHYTYGLAVRSHDKSYSAAFGELRQKLLQAATAKTTETTPYSEASYLSKVLSSEATLALGLDSADGISTVLRIKKEVEELHSVKLRLAIIGGAEAYLLAEELAAAEVGVILSPLLSDGDTWDARRALTGAPLTNGTGVDVLLDAGVRVAIGLHEDWQVRDLAWSAGTAYRNGGGRLDEKAALDLVSENVLDILGADGRGNSHFIVSEGSPLEIGSRVRAVGSGDGLVSLFV
ncbi:Imidazolonepropionase or related amidohydrolase [Geosmithia morbida]|uniref:Imidazolonepropionase or related amidohydrolase n=1 Tax=Geosmithia morbida TaxID=1094350 RepID=A0A9P4YPL3_9HYPO|nr:Imidazolonepropionase or related amidohydrolase [Geosmithia morbida]KAF4119710.1 Imidazolonepropionase or related amidohydrolase [Geosmithia morbida]